MKDLSLIQLIKEQIRAENEKAAHATPTMLYGTVTSVAGNGLATVQLDGVASPSADLETLSPVRAGDRVMLHLQHRHLVVVGAIQKSSRIDAALLGGAIGGRNLLKASGIPVTNSDYPTKIYTMSEKMVPGDTYTLRVWGSLGSGKSFFGAWLNGGTTGLVNLVSQGDGTYLGTFSGKSTGSTSEDRVYIYPYPGEISATSSITNVKLERGTVATDWTPASEDYVEKSALLDTLYPVGSIYTTTSNAATCPIQTALGGTWVNYGGGRVLAGLDTTQPEFDTIGKTGGAKTHTLTIDQMPKHGHRTRYHSNTATGLWGLNEQNGYGSISSSDDPAVSLIEHAGGGAAHNNLQPYIVVRHWRRTA